MKITKYVWITYLWVFFWWSTNLMLGIGNIIRLIVLAPFEVLIIFSANWTVGFRTANTKTCHWTHSSARSIIFFHHDRVCYNISHQYSSKLPLLKMILHWSSVQISSLILSSDEVYSICVIFFILLGSYNILPTFCCNLYFLCWIWPMFQYSDKIFLHGEAIAGLSNMLVLQLQKVVQHASPEILEQYCVILVEALTFGPVHRRDQRSVITHNSAFGIVRLLFVSVILLLVLYGCDIWPLTKREHWMIVFEKNSTKENIWTCNIWSNRESINLHIEGFHNLLHVCNIVRLNKARGMIQWHS